MKKRMIAALTAVFCLFVCSACSLEEKTDEKNTAASTESTASTAATESTTATENKETENKDKSFSFADIEDLEFYYSNGVGAWHTKLEIDADGSFEGDYSDTDMGDAANAYPNGTVYRSEFSGRFTQPKRVDDLTYEIEIESLEYERDLGEEIEDGIRYINTEAAGLDGKKFYIYLPGSDLNSLPEDFLFWLGLGAENTEGKKLENYGLYNADGKSGFVGYKD